MSLPKLVKEVIEAARRQFITLNVRSGQLKNTDHTQIANQAFLLGATFGYKQGTAVGLVALDVAAEQFALKDLSSEKCMEKALTLLKISDKNDLTLK